MLFEYLLLCIIGLNHDFNRLLVAFSVICMFTHSHVYIICLLMLRQVLTFLLLGSKGNSLSIQFFVKFIIALDFQFIKLETPIVKGTKFNLSSTSCGIYQLCTFFK